MKTIEGPCGIKATMLADSVSPSGKRLRTFELEYPRIILAELNTHRMLSKNSFSSRATPFDKMLNQLNGRPVRFGANQAGMQDKGEEFNGFVHIRDSDGFGNFVSYPLTAEEAWDQAKQTAIEYAKAFKDAGYHKQVYNRLLEPWQMMKTVLSGTEFDNFYWLRKHGAADPTFEALAQTMYECEQQSVPTLLRGGDWHLPYLDCVKDGVRQNFFIVLADVEIQQLTLEQAIKVSCARCAAVSYRNENYGLEKSLELYDRLVGSDRKHASALEHCATPMAPMKMNIGTHMTRKDYINVPSEPSSWETGVTHMDKKKNLWSGNFNGFIQYRKLVPGENYMEGV